jgi:hypothetical protein
MTYIASKVGILPQFGLGWGRLSAMSKKSRKQKAGASDATVKNLVGSAADDASLAVSAESASQLSSESPPNVASSAPVQSLAPTTDEIDDDWGSSVDLGSATSCAESTASTGVPDIRLAGAKDSPSAIQTASDGETSPRDRGEMSHSVPPPVKSSTMRPPPLGGAAVVGGGSWLRPVAVPRSLTPVGGFGSVLPPPPLGGAAVAAGGGMRLHPSAAPRSLTPAGGFGSVPPPPPSVRKPVPMSGMPLIPGEVLPRPSAVPPAASGGSRPSANPEKPSSCTDSQGNAAPPVVRAVVLPPLSAAPSVAVKPKLTLGTNCPTELTGPSVPLPQAAATAIIEAPAPLELELSEVGPSESRTVCADVTPPPLPEVAAIGQVGTPDEDMDVVVELELESLAPEEPSPPTTKSSCVSAIATPVVPAFAEISSKLRAMSRPSASQFAISFPPTALERPVSVLPTVPMQPLSEEPPRQRRARSRLPWVLLWVMTAAVPATTVWWFMRAPMRAEIEPMASAVLPAPMPTVSTAESAAVLEAGDAATATSDVSVADASASMEGPGSDASSAPLREAPADSAPVVPDASGRVSAASASAASVVTSPSGLAAGLPVASDGSESPPGTVAEDASAVPLIVETDAKDRVDVLVKSNPDGARVLRVKMDKELGHTPLTIRIGRGERRTFVFGAAGFEFKRVTVDDERPELYINLNPKTKATSTFGKPTTMSSIQ